MARAGGSWASQERSAFRVAGQRALALTEAEAFQLTHSPLHACPDIGPPSRGASPTNGERADPGGAAQRRIEILEDGPPRVACT